MAFHQSVLRKEILLAIRFNTLIFTKQNLKYFLHADIDIA